MRRRTEIVIETEQLLLLRNGRKTGGVNSIEALTWCNRCSMWVRPLSTDEAALASHVSSLGIFHQIEAGAIHYMESEEGLMLICPNSLPVPQH